MSDTELFHYFCDTTRNFNFSYTEKSAAQKFSGTFHEQRIKSLIKSVRHMAVKKSLQTSDFASIALGQEDWIQQAMITMFECCQSYDGERPFDNYVRFMVSRKMEDIQRTLLRKNPPVDRERLRLYTEMKKIKGDKKKLRQLAATSGYTEKELIEISSSGVGSRTVTAHDEQTEYAVSQQYEVSSATPEDQVEQDEIRQILLHCIDKLTELKQRVFRLHEMQELSLRAIFDHINYDRSFATFKRWYKNDVYETVRRCVSANI